MAAHRSGTKNTRNLAAPTGGDGGRGGHVYVVADVNLNTLIDFRYARRFEAKRGQHGMGSDMFGSAGDDITLKMPVGTIISDAETVLGAAVNCSRPEKKSCWPAAAMADPATCASRAPSTGAPRQKTPGYPGEKKSLQLELKAWATWACWYGLMLASPPSLRQ